MASIGTQPSSDRTSTLGRAMREPLLHFLLLAALLFVAHALFGNDTREEIVVDQETQRFLLERETDLTLAEPSRELLDQVIENFVEDEILVREATKRGFTDSSRVRALLIQNMRFFISGNIAEPTEDELRRFYEAEKSRFASPPSLDLDHIYYEDTAAAPADLVARLNGGADPGSYGQLDLAYGRTMRFMDVRRLSSAFGPDNARAILDLPTDNVSWHGPFLTPQGTAYFIRIINRNAPQVPDFETARDWIATQWLASKSRELLDNEMATMREGYRIVVEPLDAL